MTALLLALLLSQNSPEGAGSQNAGSQDIVAPKAECPGPPEYPTSEKASGVGGRVVVNVTLDDKGQVSKAEVFQSLSPAFDEAALAQVKRCNFTAALMNGKAMPSIVQLTADFVPPLQPWTLEGDVVGELGEPLPGAVVELGGRQVTSDADGHFKIVFEELPPGDGWVRVTSKGHADKAFPELFKPGLTTRARYKLPLEAAYETRVEGSRLLPPVPDVDRTPQVSKFTITRADIDRTVGAMEDVTRVAQQAPGVAADPDLLGTLFVRGGGPDEVIFYLDGVPLSNPYHLGGFLSVFNPQMLESAEFYTGGVPARFEPTLSGALEIHYATGETKKPHLLADISMQTAMLRADVPLGIEGLSAVVSFRRSYFEAYFAILRAAKIVGSNFFAPEITEAVARVNFRRGRHNTTATYMFTADGLNLQISPGEAVLFDFTGSLKLFNRLHLASLQHKIDFGGDSHLTFQASYTFDSSYTESAQILPGQQKPRLSQTYSNNARRGDLTIRTDGVLATMRNRLQAGVQYSHRNLYLEGSVADTTYTGTWASLPSVNTWVDYLQINPQLVRDLLSAYVEHTYRPLDTLSIEAGGRAQVDAVSGTFSGSARVATAWTSPISTVLKLSAGFAAQPVQYPLMLDSTYGNPSLSPERSFQVVAGLEQPLPIEALLRLEVWGKYLDQLVVNPDTLAGAQERKAAGQPVFVNAGTGFARGADLMFLGRTRYFFYGLSAGLLASDRTNPLAATRQTYPTPWDQKFTAAASLTWSPNDHWMVTGRFSFRTGRPVTGVQGFTYSSCKDPEDASKTVECWLPTFDAVNGDRYPSFYELSFRGEYRFAIGPVKSAVYLELMNVTNAMNAFVYLYSTGTTATPAMNGMPPVAAMPPERSQVNHLPFRPFLGIRAEY